MYSVDQKVEFKRSNGKWSVGTIQTIEENYVTVQWNVSNDTYGTKKVHKAFIKKHRFWTKYKKPVIGLIMLIMLLIMDSYFYLKKVYW